MAQQPCVKCGKSDYNLRYAKRCTNCHAIVCSSCGYKEQCPKCGKNTLK
jgi:hypothetical protein